MTISKNILVKGLAVIPMLAMMACDSSYEALPLEYQKDPYFGAPDIQTAWQLEEVPDMVEVAGVYGYKDLALNNMLTRNLGWNGGDGGGSLKLPDGNVYWTFNDSFYGVVDPETRSRGTCSFPRNSVMIQTVGEDGFPGMKDENLIWCNDFIQTSDPNAHGYYCAKTFEEHPLAGTVNGFNDHGIAQDWLYWAGDATICGDEIHMLWNGVDTSNGLSTHGTALAKYSIKGTPGDGEYMRRISIDHDFLPENPFGYGSTLMEDEDGHIYLYSTHSPGLFMNYPIVARTIGSTLDSGWEYYAPTPDGAALIWQKEYPTEAQINKVNIMDGTNTSVSMPWFFKKDGYYYMVAQGYLFSWDIYISRAENPWGPFTKTQKLFSLPKKLDKLGNQTSFHYYMINLHESLSREGELVFSTNSEVIDPLTFWNNFNEEGSADWYRLYFYRIYHWERMFR